MTSIVYDPASLRALAKLPKPARRAVVAKRARCAETGAGDVKALVGTLGIRLRVGNGRLLFLETADAIEVFAIGDRHDIHRREDGAMTSQFIRIEGGEELVVLTRRAYDARLAQLGDETAEDRAAARLADDYLAAKDAGLGAAIPHRFAVSVAEHGSSVCAARKQCDATRSELARSLGRSVAVFEAIEHGRSALSDAQRPRLAERTGIALDWLV
ncbi:hypothetical protein [uncultured Methylobacterium sp.]|uniref:hypothetical protein n=1 Tax=uncultured Methylobacterium sp. TaxID=157278 RepID=UPI0035CA9253